MAELIDLTLTLGSERASDVPGLMGVETSQLQTHESHARSNQKLCLATHIGTHVDAPYHFVEGAATVDQMPLEKYMGPTVLLDLRSMARGLTPLQVSELEGADYLAKTGVNAVAVDFPIDKHPATPLSTIHDFPVHRPLLGQNIPLIENLINLDQLVGREFELWALPLKLKGGDGTATRAVARIT